MPFNKNAHRTDGDKHGQKAKSAHPYHHRRTPAPPAPPAPPPRAAAAAAAPKPPPKKSTPDAVVAAPRPPPYQPAVSLSQLEQRRTSFRDPFATTPARALGSAGKRAHVPGQEKLRVRDYMGEMKRADGPGTGFRILRALEGLREKLREKEKEKNQKAGQGGGEGGKKGGGGQGKKHGKEKMGNKWGKEGYTP